MFHFKNILAAYQRIFECLLNFILLFFTYFIGIGPIWLISKLTKKKFLNMSFRGKKSYWIKSNLGNEEKEKYRIEMQDGSGLGPIGKIEPNLKTTGVVSKNKSQL